MPGRLDERVGSSEPQSLTTRFEVDPSQPTTSIQLRLADGTRHVPFLLKMLLLLTANYRMVCRMNLTHTVGDIRNFINAWVSVFMQAAGDRRFTRSNPVNLTRPYTVGTAFPNKTLDDDTQTIKDAGLANTVILQRWA